MRYIVSSFFFLYSSLALGQSSTVEISNGKVEYELKGESNIVLLLEAGGSAGLSDWDPVFHELSLHYKTLRYSRLGNGKSTAIRKNYSSDEYAKEATELLDVLNIRSPVIYVAHSYGAYIARVFAANYPSLVAGIVLIEPASEHDVDIMRKIDLPLAEKQIAQIKLDDLNNGMSNQYLDFWAKRPLPDYPQIKDIPVTVIASVKKYKDPKILFFTDEGRRLWGELHKEWVDNFPQGRLILTENSYHYPQNDEPELVVREVLKMADELTHLSLKVD